MIFVTVGAQMPFDRLVSAADAWAAAAGRRDVFAQIGAGGAPPLHVEWAEMLDPVDFRRNVDAAEVVVTHAGMGTILTALEVGKPIVVMPRLGRLHETRNDHQVATARKFLELGRVRVAESAEDLSRILDHVTSLRATERIAPFASPQLIGALHDFVETAGSAAERG